MEPTVKILLLKNGNLSDYLIGSVTELDEEPSIFVERCYRILDCAEYGENPEELEQRALLLESAHAKLQVKKIDEKEGKEWYAYEYAILEPYPRYSSQRDLFLTSDSVFTIVDPDKTILDLYNKHIA